MIAIHDVLVALAAQRPIYHSEADFQHALAWEIHKRLPTARVRLERRMLHEGKAMHIDLWIERGADLLAIELKYKTRPISYQHGDEQFNVLSHGAQDLGRYDFIKDVQRLEACVDAHPSARGLAILLTNDPSYWSAATGAATIDTAFRIQEGRTLTGTLAWATHAGIGTTRGRESALTLRGSYPVQWHSYSTLPVTTSGVFRYVVLDTTR
jgi:hypothetical protein